MALTFASIEQLAMFSVLADGFLFEDENVKIEL